MDWDAVGAMAELLGAIAVLATLVYLARQIKQSRDSVKSASAETVLSNMNAAFQNAAVSPVLGRVLFVGQGDLNELTEEERATFAFWFFGYLRTLELAHHHYLAGNFSEAIWAGYSRHTQSLVHTSGVKKYWQVRREVFSPEFVAYVDALMKEETTVVPSYLVLKEVE